MNAYELADGLRTIGTMPSYEIQIFLMKTATMLRQQAKRIEELEKEADRLSEHASELRKVHAKRINQLESHKELKDEEILKLFNYQEQKFNGMIVNSDFVLNGIRAVIKSSRGEE